MDKPISGFSADRNYQYIENQYIINVILIKNKFEK